jgi:hypothetical protein
MRMVSAVGRTTLGSLEHDTDPTIVASWIAEVKGERLGAEQAIIAARPQSALTTDELQLLVAEPGDMRSVLATADQALKAEVYRDVVGLRMIYRPADDTLAVSTSPWAKGCVGGPSSLDSEWRILPWDKALRVLRVRAQ